MQKERLYKKGDKIRFPHSKDFWIVTDIKYDALIKTNVYTVKNEKTQKKLFIRRIISRTMELSAATQKSFMIECFENDKLLNTFSCFLAYYQDKFLFISTKQALENGVTDLVIRYNHDNIMDHESVNILEDKLSFTYYEDLIGIVPKKNLNNLFHKAYDLSSDFYNLVLGDTVNIIGYPMGFSSDTLPIWLTGHIASEINIDTKSTFLVDSRTPKSQSGSPVIFRLKKDELITKNGKDHRVVDEAIIILGVYIKADNLKDTDLGIVYKNSAIRELF